MVKNKKICVRIKKYYSVRQNAFLVCIPIERQNFSVSYGLLHKLTSCEAYTIQGTQCLPTLLILN